MKVIKVHNCKECPFFERPNLHSKGWCLDRRLYILDCYIEDDQIPGWCMLENLTLFIGTDDAYISNNEIKVSACNCQFTCLNGYHKECVCRICHII